jgi:general stress protein YciG
MKRAMTLAELRSAGGKARAKKLTKKRRSEIARMGGKAKASNRR